jgi:hypothetical protein
MTFSDTSRTKVSYIKETTYGETPNGAMTATRFTGESLAIEQENTRSNEIRSDRQVTNYITTDEDPGGDLNYELSFAAYDDFFESAFCNGWENAVSISATDIQAVSGSPDSFTSSTTDFVAEGVKAGQWLLFAGFTETDNNGYFQVLSVAANAITINGETDLTNEAAGDSITIKGQSIRNGVTKKSLSMEVLFDDVSEYKTFKGMVVNTLNLSINVGEIVSGAMNFIGKSGKLQSSTLGTGSEIDAPENDVMNAVDNIKYVMEGDTAFAGEIQELTVAMNNALRAQKAIKNLGNVGVGLGTLEVTGTLNAYFEGGAASLYKKYQNKTRTSLSIRFTDTDNNSYILTLPKIKFTAGDITAGGQDDDVIEEMEYSIERHETYNFMVQLDKFPSS